jgi:YtcA family
MVNDFLDREISRIVSQPHSPTLDLLGSYFPAWMLCAAAGVVAAVVVRQVLSVAGIGDYVVAPLLTYAGLALSATWLIWLLLFGH